MKDRFEFRCSEPQKARWQAEADRVGISLGSWLRLLADREVAKATAKA